MLESKQVTSSQKNHNSSIHLQMISPLLKRALLALKSKKKPFSLIDIGCGQGDLLYLLKKENYLKEARVTGIDIDKRAIQVFKKKLPWAKAIVADASHLKMLKSSSLDFVICNQVIEHVEDDEALILEIKRLLKTGGFLYLTSVLKKWYGFYWHRNKFGQIVVDPTHVREYGSSEEFANLLIKEGLCIKNLDIHPGNFPLGDYFLLLLAKAGILNFTNLRYYYLAHPRIYQFSKKMLFLPMPGYAIIEVVAEKR